MKKHVFERSERKWQFHSDIEMEIHTILLSKWNSSIEQNLETKDG